ncbi:MAG: sensory box histidine kinase/response regulator, partial [Geminicoccaceae bacterium]|nr:sensory box histidine kinase/response regulator [Geminicoccaceae bacterium]
MAATILVVADEAIARTFMQRALTQDGFEVILASDGEEALETLRTSRRKIDLIVTDLVMPGMGGHAFAIEVAPLTPTDALHLGVREAPGRDGQAVPAKALQYFAANPGGAAVAGRGSEVCIVATGIGRDQET